MSMHVSNLQGRPLDTEAIESESAMDGIGRLDEGSHSLLLGPTDQKYVEQGSISISHKLLVLTAGMLLLSALAAGFITLVMGTVPNLHHVHATASIYGHTLHKARVFFKAQRCNIILNLHSFCFDS